MPVFKYPYVSASNGLCTCACIDCHAAPLPHFIHLHEWAASTARSFSCSQVVRVYARVVEAAAAGRGSSAVSLPDLALHELAKQSPTGKGEELLSLKHRKAEVRAAYVGLLHITLHYSHVYVHVVTR